MIKTHHFILTLLLLPVSLSAQQSLGDMQDDNVAFEAFQQGQHRKVIRIYEEMDLVNANDEILYLLSRLKTGEDISEEVADWINHNQKDPRRMMARFYQSEFFFYKGDTVKSARYLKQVRYKELSEKEQGSYGFMYGVINLQNQRFKNAYNLFKIAEKSGVDNNAELSYYQGFAAYHLDRGAEALGLFGEARKDPAFDLSSKFFIAKIELESGKYDEVIALAQGELSEEKSKVNAGFYQLIGEAYVLKKDLAKADAYFDQAIRLHPNRPSAALYYQAGVSKFKLGNQDKALQYLTEAGIGSGPYAQLSAFQLGRLYIQRDEYENALAAYQEASSAKDPSIQEESIYQSAKLNAILDRFTEAINYSDDYLKLYPDGQWKGEMEDLIAESYLRTSDYDLAISHLEKLGVRGEKQRQVFQKVTFQKGILRFNDGDFNEAQIWFQKSLQYSEEMPLASDAHFYLAEILMQKGRYEEAIKRYKSQNSLNSPSNYGIGYAYFNQRSYVQAIPYFRSASGAVDQEIKRDATLRLADCYYASKEYESALDVYSKLDDTDYILFQKGMVQRNMSQIQQARASFNRVSSASSWKDDAIYNKSLLEFEIAAFENAASGFSELIDNHPRSIYLSKAYLNRAVTRSNIQDLPGSVEDYEHVIDHFIQSQEAFSAILGLQELKQRGVETGDIDELIARFKKANPENGSLELVEFESAKSDYFDLAYESTIPKLLSFIKNYPKSKFKSEAQYYLGDAYYRTGRLSEANEVLQKQKFVRNIYTGRILYRLGTINYQLQEYEQAIESYDILLKLNLSPKDNFNARQGLMDSHFASEKYMLAIQSADQILIAEWKPSNADRKANYIKGRSHLALNQVDLARTTFDALRNGEDQYAVEAGFYLGKLTYEEGKYDEALEVLFSVIERFGSYTEWIERSYLLVADVYIKKEELFQAKATLRSIIQHSKDEEVRSEAQLRLNQIEGTTDQDTTEVREE